MRQIQWMTRLFMGGVAIAVFARPAFAQPGHAPFTYAPFEIDNFERTLVAPGVAGATILNRAKFNDINQDAFSHPAVIANGQNPTPYLTGAPMYLESAFASNEVFGGILGHVGAGPGANFNTFNDIFAGGWMVTPNGWNNGGQARNLPSSFASYNGTKFSTVNKTDGNAADNVAVTSGNQAMRISMWNVGQGDLDTSYDIPAVTAIKPSDFWGVADSRYNTWETVRADPSQYNISLDITVLASEIPDTFAPTFGPYFRLGIFSGHGYSFDVDPSTVLQGPESLLFDGGDADNDGKPNFTDEDWVDPENTPGLPGFGVPGVMQRRYVFPASAMAFPAAMNPPTAGNEFRGTPPTGAGGLSDAYVMGFVTNGNWTLTVPDDAQGDFPQSIAAFMVDNIKVLPRNPITAADFNNDGNLTGADWQILVNNLNSLTANTFAQGDIGSLVEENLVSPGVVDFADFVRFEEIWDANNGGSGSFRQFLTGVPEPTCMMLVLIGLGSLALGRRRPTGRLVTLLVAACVVFWSTSASAALTDTLLFSFENSDLPDSLQRWDSQTVPDNTVQPPDADTDPDDVVLLATTATGATIGTQALSITQRIPPTVNTPINGAFVSIFGSESGLPPQQEAFNTALDVGANNYELWLDITYRDASIPDTTYISLQVGLSAGSATNDFVRDLAISDGATNETVTVKIPLSIDPVDTTIGNTVLSVPNQASLAGSYNINIALDGDWLGNATVFIDNVRLVQKTQPPLLTLEINPMNGLGTIKNTPGADAGTGDVIFDYYEIRSAFPDNPSDFNNNGTVDAADYTVWRDNLGLVDTAAQADGDANGDGDVTAADYALWKAAFGAVEGPGTSLNPGGWNSLDEQNVDPNGAAVIDNWAQGAPSSTVLSEVRLNGSSTWSNLETLPIGNVYTPGAPRNITFRYREPSRPNFLQTGFVTYLPGGSGSLSAVPEPTSFALALVAGLFLAVRRPS